MKVVNRYSIMVHNSDADPSGTMFSFPLNVPFIPDELIVKQVTMNGLSAGTTQVYYIMCPQLIPLAPLCSVINATSTNLDNRFIMNGQQVNGTYTFTYNNENAQSVMNCWLNIHLEFVKYGDSK